MSLVLVLGVVAMVGFGSSAMTAEADYDLAKLSELRVGDVIPKFKFLQDDVGGYKVYFNDDPDWYHVYWMTNTEYTVTCADHTEKVIKLSGETPTPLEDRFEGVAIDRYEDIYPFLHL